MDGDGDGFLACEECDDADGGVFPGGVEVCNGVDDDCDGQLPPDELDLDGDGWMGCEECGGVESEWSYPGAVEICDGFDNDCDGEVDEDEAPDASLWYLDGDGDGFGDPAISEVDCDPVPGHVANGDDCDDGNGDVYPGAPPLCDGVTDNDCDSQIDDNESDDDGDGFDECAGDCDDGDPAMTPVDGDGDGVSTCDGDCDDVDPAVYPGAPPACDGVSDNDCDGIPDPDEADLDGDGVTLCAGDCDDEDGDSYPGATELCDGIDNDCDGVGDTAGYWPFDEGLGDVVGDQGGLGLDGEVVDAVWTTGIVGGALDFDGVTAHVVLDHPELRPMNGMTLSVWVAPDSMLASSWDTVISHGSGGAYDGCCGDSYFLGYYLRGISWYTGDQNDGFNLLHDSTDYVGHIGAWHHLAATWDTDTGERAIYVDGVLTHSDGNAPAVPYYDEVPMRIGSDTNNGVAVLHFDGLIDEVKMFTCPLDDAQIAADFGGNWPF